MTFGELIHNLENSKISALPGAPRTEWGVGHDDALDKCIMHIQRWFCKYEETLPKALKRCESCQKLISEGSVYCDECTTKPHPVCVTIPLDEVCKVVSVLETSMDVIQDNIIRLSNLHSPTRQERVYRDKLNSDNSEALASLLTLKRITSPTP